MAATARPGRTPLRRRPAPQGGTAPRWRRTLITASDLAATPRSGVTVQLCGDAHRANFGMFASPERQPIFDINGFDQTLPGPWEWDVERPRRVVRPPGRGSYGLRAGSPARGATLTGPAHEP